MPGTVGIAVLGYPVPDPARPVDVRCNHLRMAGMVTGIVRNLPGLDLLVFPEYVAHGVGPDPGVDPEEVVAVVARACRTARVWAAFGVTAGGLRPAGGNAAVLIDPAGRVAARHHRPAVGPAHRTVVTGPAGLRTALEIDDATGRPGCAGCPVGGAELVLRLHRTPQSAPPARIAAARALAWMNTCYVVSVNATGTVAGHEWNGHSAVVGFDGAVLAHCEDEVNELAFAEVSAVAVRRARVVRLRRERAMRAALGNPAQPSPLAVLG